MSLKSEITEYLKNSGFDLVGIANLDDASLINATQKYDSWIDSGFQGSMEYLKKHRAKKANPALLLENCHSVVCVGLSYSQPILDHTKNDKPLISLYTKGEDYHLVLKKKLDQACAFLDQKYNSKSKTFTDIEPVMERFWAWRAGLGWIGKNSMLIHRQVGSFFFIGGFLTTLELDADIPGTDHCGKCNKCIIACPTNAILPNRTINSNDCIGYHTIESKNPVLEKPDHSPLAGLFGTWIAGCDICQNVCPWNDPPFNKMPFFKLENPIFEMTFEELVQIDELQFKEKISGFSMERMKFSGFLKNLTIAIVNSSLKKEKKTLLIQKIESTLNKLPDSERKKSLKIQIDWAHQNGF